MGGINVLQTFLVFIKEDNNDSSQYIKILFVSSFRLNNLTCGYVGILTRILTGYMDTS
jgi:hypothetical protein